MSGGAPMRSSGVTPIRAAARSARGVSGGRCGAPDRAHAHACDRPRATPPRCAAVSKKDFKLQNWSEALVTPLACEAAAAAGAKGEVVQELSLGMLTHEPRSMRDTLETYEKGGLFDLVTDFMVYVNKRRPEIDEVLKPYLDKYGAKFRVLGDANNYGIARGIISLTSNASNPYFLFLERDFQLVSPATCITEQLRTGVQLLKDQTAHVVRYRHRKKAGRPNWAERMFRGHEDDVFKGGQPNLFCNHYYWVPDPDKRWPDKMWICNKVRAAPGGGEGAAAASARVVSHLVVAPRLAPRRRTSLSHLASPLCAQEPVMYCSDSYYCNWTNNPQMWSVAWWNKEYVNGRLPKWTRNDPYYDLEVWMNWEPGSWNDEKFIVAEGDGLFKHVDRGNYGY